MCPVPEQRMLVWFGTHREEERDREGERRLKSQSMQRRSDKASPTWPVKVCWVLQTYMISFTFLNNHSAAVKIGIREINLESPVEIQTR